MHNDEMSTTLSNLKFLSSCHSSEKKEDWLKNIDMVLQDILLESKEANIIVSNVIHNEKHINASTQPNNTFLSNDIAHLENAEKDDDGVFIPIETSIQYNKIEDIVAATEAYVRIRKQSDPLNEISLPNSDCSHCSSLEMVHTKQLCELSTWRKTLMHVASTLR